VNRKYARTNRYLTRLLVVVLLLSFGANSALAAQPGITPPAVEALIFPGESLDVNKTVTTPEIPPTPDIYFLADSTGSMGPAIANVQANATAILSAVAAVTTDPQFGAGDYKDFFGLGSTYAFNNAAPIAADAGASALAAIAAWSAGGGGDGSEAQFFALDQLGEGVANWRADSAKIVVWFGDWPGHDPVCDALTGLGYDIDEASLTAKLVAAEIRVIAVSTTTGPAAGLDDDPTTSAIDYSGTCAINGTAGQASRIAAATGGVALLNVPPEEVTNAILAGLQLLPAEVSMASDCTDPISTTFAPASQVVTSGDDAVFLETISVAADAAGGTYTCRDWALINGEPLTDAAGNIIYEDKTIHVPGIDLQPATDTNELGFDLDHTVVATVTAGDYGPVAGVRVEFEILSGPNAATTGVGVTDAAGEASFTYTPAVDPAHLGTDTIQACFTDPGDTVVYGCDTAEKTWQDTTPPTALCTPTVNPAGRNVPNAPGQGGQGQNQDGFYALLAEDVVWPVGDLGVFVTDMGSGTVFGPYPVGTNIKYVQAPGATPSVAPMGGNRGGGGGGTAVGYLITGTGDAQLTAVDGSGNVSAPAACLVPPPPM
jgi:hypothetical protein